VQITSALEMQSWPILDKTAVFVGVSLVDLELTALKRRLFG